MDSPSITEQAERPMSRQGICPILRLDSDWCLKRSSASSQMPAAKTPRLSGACEGTERSENCVAELI